MSLSRMAAALGVGLFCLSSHPPALAAGPDELEQVKSQLAELRQSYEARLQALEKRIAELQQAAAPAPTTAATAVAASPPPMISAAGPPGAANPDSSAAANAAPPVVAATPTSPSATAFNPAISLILAGRYANLSRDPDTYKLQGFVPTGGEVGPEARGFSLGESELGISASIDPTFSGRLTAAFAPDNSVGVEEAWFQGAGLFEGGNLRAGRFLSGIGYLNERHAHTWDFVDAPLVLSGLLRRPDQDRRSAGALGRADGSLRRNRRRGRLGNIVSRQRQRPQRGRLCNALRPPRRRHRRQRQLARRRLAAREQG